MGVAVSLCLFEPRRTLEVKFTRARATMMVLRVDPAALLTAAYEPQERWRSESAASC